MVIHEALLGLGVSEAARGLQQDAFNELPTPDKRGYLRIVAEVLRQPMFALLLGGGAIYLLLEMMKSKWFRIGSGEADTTMTH